MVATDVRPTKSEPEVEESARHETRGLKARMAAPAPPIFEPALDDAPGHEATSEPSLDVDDPVVAFGTDDLTPAPRSSPVVLQVTRRHVVIGVAVALLFVIGAAAIVVTPWLLQGSTPSTGLVAGKMEILQQGSAAGAVGESAANPVELAEAPATARQAIAVSDYFFQLEISEEAASAVKPGTYRVELFADGASMGALFVRQTDAQPGIERAILQWDLGASVHITDGMRIAIHPV